MRGIKTEKKTLSNHFCSIKTKIDNYYFLKIMAYITFTQIEEVYETKKKTFIN